MRTGDNSFLVHYCYKRKLFGLIKLDHLFSSLHVHEAISLFGCTQALIEIAQPSN
jgi:hypothetical protein